jgi:glycerophosphoryl diester phosphodiesterase
MRLVGHRGAAFEAPENTVDGFRYAIEIGVRAFEFDVHPTKDDRIVVIHDGTVDRTTNGTGAVSDFTLDALQTLDARAGFSDWPTISRIPTLDDVLKAIAEIDYFEIEFKRYPVERLDPLVKGTLDAIRAHGLAEKAVVTSSEPYALYIAKRYAPEIRRGINGAWITMAFAELALDVGASQAAIGIERVTDDMRRWLKEHGISHTCWNINSEEAFEEARARGIETLGTDRPAAVLSWLNAHPAPDGVEC